MQLDVLTQLFTAVHAAVLNHRSTHKSALPCIVISPLQSQDKTFPVRARNLQGVDGEGGSEKDRSICPEDHLPFVQKIRVLQK